MHYESQLCLMFEKASQEGGVVKVSRLSAECQRLLAIPGQPFPGIAPSAAEVTRTVADITRQFSSLRLQPTYRVGKNRSAVSCFNTTTPLSNLRKENGKLLGKMKQMEDRVAEIDEARRAQGIEIHALTSQYDTLQAEQVKLKKAVESRDKKIEFLKSELAKLTGN
ncbi:hypothetical protein DL95DRAFT_452874 [Leptodontidium sp. 2 PMI_412]|nr:hypothetical protein DL95DRAFT_452874 [Leptodontidium sp. 2 PMI_412]